MFRPSIVVPVVWETYLLSLVGLGVGSRNVRWECRFWNRCLSIRESRGEMCCSRIEGECSEKFFEILQQARA